VVADVDADLGHRADGQRVNARPLAARARDVEVTGGEVTQKAFRHLASS
jgi:hypothetical protein